MNGTLGLMFRPRVGFELRVRVRILGIMVMERVWLWVGNHSSLNQGY